MTRHNHLTQNVLQWFHEKFTHYLQWNRIKNMKCILILYGLIKCFNTNTIQCIWMSLGLSSIAILKLLQSFGVEYSAADEPQNGDYKY